MSKNTVTIDKDLQEIVPMFIDNRQKDLKEIKVFLEETDLAGIQNIAHKLAGNAGSYGFTGLGQIGADMEEACKANDLEKVQSLYQNFIDYMENVEVVYE